MGDFLIIACLNCIKITQKHGDPSFILHGWNPCNSENMSAGFQENCITFAFYVWATLKVNPASFKWLKYELVKKYYHLVDKSGTTVKNAYSYWVKIQPQVIFPLYACWPMIFSCFMDYISKPGNEKSLVKKNGGSFSVLSHFCDFPLDSCLFFINNSGSCHSQN